MSKITAVVRTDADIKSVKIIVVGAGFREEVSVASAPFSAEFNVQSGEHAVYTVTGLGLDDAGEVVGCAVVAQVAVQDGAVVEPTSTIEPPFELVVSVE